MAIEGLCESTVSFDWPHHLLAVEITQKKQENKQHISTFEVRNYKAIVKPIFIRMLFTFARLKTSSRRTQVYKFPSGLKNISPYIINIRTDILHID